VVKIQARKHYYSFFSTTAPTNPKTTRGYPGKRVNNFSRAGSSGSYCIEMVAMCFGIFPFNP